jgi:hypothetical protein
MNECLVEVGGRSEILKFARVPCLGEIIIFDGEPHEIVRLVWFQLGALPPGVQVSLQVAKVQVQS